MNYRQFEVLPAYKKNQVNFFIDIILIFGVFMINELLIIITLLISFGSVVLLHRIFGKGGVFAWIGISTILANIEVTVMVIAFGMEQTLGNVLFASSFLATDVLSELYGKKEAKKGVRIGITSSLIFIIFAFLWRQYIPSENDWAMPSMRILFSNTTRIVCASLVAYIISEFIDVQLYHRIWEFSEKKTGSKQKLLWFRNNIATLISQLINIVIFNFGAFYGVYPLPTLISITITCYVIYIFTSILDTPFIYIARRWVYKEHI